MSGKRSRIKKNKIKMKILPKIGGAWYNNWDDFKKSAGGYAGKLLWNHAVVPTWEAFKNKARHDSEGRKRDTERSRPKGLEEQIRRKR